MAIPVYIRVMPSGARRDQVAGLAESGDTYTMPGGAVSGYEPAAGDIVRDSNKVERDVTDASYDGDTDIWTLTAPAPS